MDLNQKLSKNFQLWEFVTSQTAQRHGIDNTPTEKVVEALRGLCQTILQPARDTLGPLVINSGYRCLALNKAVGGSDTSGHCFGYCADVNPVNVSKMDFAKWVTKNCKFDQVILEFGTDADPAWIHLSSDPRQRGQVLKILNGTGYVPVKLG